MSVAPNASPAQRATITGLLRQAELCPRRIGLMHTRMPHVQSHHVDSTVDGWLSTLSQAQASDVIGWLQKEVS